MNEGVSILRLYDISIQKGKTWFYNHRLLICLNIIIGVLIYFMMMAENLVNDVDGIWNTSNFIAGDWEISLGRGLWRYLDKLRFGVVSVPFNTLLTICLIAISNAFLVDIFPQGNRFVSTIGTLILVANPVVCATLSYSYAAFNFGVAYLCSVLAVSLICKGKHWISLVFGAGFLAVSMCNYQAYFGVACVMLLLYLLYLIMNQFDIKQVGMFCVRVFSFVVIGGGVLCSISIHSAFKSRYYFSLL